MKASDNNLHIPCESPSTTTRSYKGPGSIFIFCMTLALLLYCLTVAPTFSWGDSADLAMRLVYSTDTTFIGTHRDYALWRYIGQIAQFIPIADAGVRANLFTAFWGAVTVGSVAMFVQLLTRSTAAALTAAASLAVSHSFWLLSVIAEVYTFNTALIALTFSCMAFWQATLKNRWLWLTAIFSGLSLAHHPIGLVLVSCVAPIFLSRRRSIPNSSIFVAAALFLIASLPYWRAFLARWESATTLLDTLGLAMSTNPNFDSSPLRELAKFSLYLFYNFPGPGFLLGLYGLRFAVKNRTWTLFPPTLWAGAVIIAGSMSTIPDKFNVYVLAYPCFATLVGFGAAIALSKYSISIRKQCALTVLMIIIPTVCYFAASRVSDFLNIDLVGARNVPLRNNSFYFLWPPKNGDRGPRIFAERTMSDLPSGAVLIADYTLWRPLEFVQKIENLRPDVKLTFVERLLPEGVDNWIDRQPCEYSIFLATNDPPSYYQMERIEARFFLRKYRSAYEVIRPCKT